jgi:hypothetical protein
MLGRMRVPKLHKDSQKTKLWKSYFEIFRIYMREGLPDSYPGNSPADPI